MPGASDLRRLPARVQACFAASLAIAMLTAVLGAPDPDPRLASIQADPDVLPLAEKLDRWRTAVEQHTAGAVDPAVYAVAGWSRETLLSILRGLAAPNRFAISADLLKRGARLHGDIGLNVKARAAGPLAPPSRGRSFPGTILSLDGLEEGAGELSFHLDFARALIDAIKPDPSADVDVRAWYRAVAARLLQAYNLADALPHLRRARDLLADDPEILLASGCLYETLSAPRVQSVMQSLDASVAVSFMTPGASRTEASKYFRRAAAVSPGLAEARVRLARLLGESGRHRDAANLLRHAVGDVRDDSALAYYAWLFLGDERQALRQFPAAGEAYQRAVDLYPRAQSARLALGQLARRLGDRRAALDAMQRTLDEAGAGLEGEDPWWRYFEGPGRKLPARSRRLQLASAARENQ